MHLYWLEFLVIWQCFFSSILFRQQFLTYIVYKRHFLSKMEVGEFPHRVERQAKHYLLKCISFYHQIV